MTSSHPLPSQCRWFARLAAVLDRRSAPRLALLFLGAVLARGRRTVTTWIRAAKLSEWFQSCYIAIAAAGKRSDRIAWRLLAEVVGPLVRGAERLTLALDDTPTKRYGPRAQGAGIHHNPTPGPSGSPYVYGHVFVVLGLLASHPAWGAIALPLLARLYIRKKDLPSIDPKHRPAFRTKLEAGRRGPCGGPSPGSACSASRSGWWPTGRMPRRTSSSQRKPWDDRRQPAPQGRGPEICPAGPAGKQGRPRTL